MLRYLLRKIPFGIRLERLFKTIFSEIKFPQSCEPGHFYSPIPSRDEIHLDKQRIFKTNTQSLPEIHIDRNNQMERLRDFQECLNPLSIPFEQKEGFRYHSTNVYFNRADALILAGIILKESPQRYIEVGSGFSSALALDVAKESTFFTFIEPRAARLRSLLRNDDKKRIKILEERVQNVETDVFSILNENDILFIDGSHIAKVGSDLNDVLFRILPSLRPGVLIHFHDIFWPFEYSEEAVMSGRSWNECYLLRAFLANNEKYEIYFFPSWLKNQEEEAWNTVLPTCKSDTPSSIWLRKKF